jgi:hypothetical protein
MISPTLYSTLQTSPHGTAAWGSFIRCKDEEESRYGAHVRTLRGRTAPRTGRTGQRPVLLSTSCGALEEQERKGE